MTLSTNPKSYTDCLQALEAAEAKRGLRLKFPSRKDATVFRHRCYAARKVFNRFGELMITLEKEEDFTWLIIRPREISEAYDLEGNPIDLREIRKVDEDEGEMPEFDPALLEGLDLGDES